MSGRRPPVSGRNNGSSNKNSEADARMNRRSQVAPQTSSSSHSRGTRLPLLDGPSPPALPAGTSSSSTKSFLTTPHDKMMASRQLQINKIPLHEREEQERWAQRQLQLGAGACPSDCAWRRIKDGYQCTGMGNHLVTDKLLAKGQGVCYQRIICAGKATWIGPMSKMEIDEFNENGCIPARVAKHLPSWVVLKDIRHTCYDGYEIDDRRVELPS